MSNHYDTKNCSILRLLAKGQFAEIERLCINNPTLRSVLLHWRGIRDTAFFKNRLRFYREFAKQSNLREFSPEIKNKMRDEFAKRHCIKQTLSDVIDSYDMAAFTTKISLIRFNQVLKKRCRNKLRL